MTWAAPGWLFGLAAPAAVALALWLSGRLGRREAGPRWPRVSRVLASASGFEPVPPGKVVRRPWLLLAAASLSIVALARPQWGEVEVSVAEQAREVMIALDLSRSMLVDDVSPSRIDRARLLVRSLLNNLRGERVGLIVFAGTAFVQVPLSADYEILSEFLPELTPDYMPQGGTDYEGMLRSALESFGEDSEADRFLIVLSDGESTTEGWRTHLNELQERNARVLALGIGTPAGGFVPDPKSGYAKDERGAVVLSRLESATLQELAATTGGAYRDASIWVDLPALLEETVALGRLRSFEEQRRIRRLERFQWLLGPAALLVLLGIWREFPVRPASRSVPVRPAVSRGMRAASTAALMVFACLIHPAPVGAADTDEAPAVEERIRATVARLIASPEPSAADWRELAEQTLAWGTEIRAGRQPVPPGPVRDALSAVDLGERSKPAEANWQQLRHDLQELLTSEPPPPQEEPEQEPEDSGEPQDEEKESENEPGSPGQPDQQPPSEEQANDQDQQDESPTPEDAPGGSPQDDNQSQSAEQPAANDSPAAPGNQSPSPAGAEMGELAAPGENESPPQPQGGERRPPDGETRKIGGQRAGNTPPAESLDPQQAAALQELRDVQKRDAPARLFELLEGEAVPSQPGPNW